MTIKVVDFFSGCGGTSAGLRAAGMDIILGLDTDPDAANTFTANFPEAHFIKQDIRSVETEALAPYLLPHQGQPLLFSGCAPCQPFSKQNHRRKMVDDRVALLLQFGRFVERYLPDFIFVENVPRFRRGGVVAGDPSPFVTFVGLLERLGYFVDHRVVDARDYGVPQWRKRLVLIAAQRHPPSFPMPTHGPGTPSASYATAWEWIGDLPPIAAGETHPAVPNHRAANLSPLNLCRIRATPIGGGRLDWPIELRLPCHLGDYAGHTDVYGRMHKDRPASGLTTRCISLSNGRFGHPVQDRAISVREAACLQTFPRDFVFRGNLNSLARQIGNAVPPLLVERFGTCFAADLTVSDVAGMP
jgi:DNA (cytosine-5)-methyltransferase 1